MASSPSFSSAFAMDVVAPHNDNTDQIATTPTSLGKMLTPTRAATMTTMTAATSIIDEYNAQSAMKVGNET